MKGDSTMKRNNLLPFANAVIWTLAAFSYGFTAFLKRNETDWWSIAMVPLCAINATLSWLAYRNRQAK